MGSSLPQAVQAFEDVGSSHWAKQEIQLLKDKQLIAGYEDGSFRPEGTITRAEAVTILTRMLKLPTDSTASLRFSDVLPKHWSAGAIAAASHYKLIAGYEDGSFRPDNRISRAEAAVLIDRLYRFQEPAPAFAFKDVDRTHWAYGEIMKLAANGVIAGTTDQRFEPDQLSTRAEFVALLARALGKDVPQAISASQLTAIGGDSAVKLQWGAIKNTDHAGFNVYLNGVKHNSSLLTSTVYDVKPLQFGVNYSFKVTSVDQKGNETTVDSPVMGTPLTYLLELSRWGIYNDGTHPAETTKGFNDALQWAQHQKITAMKVPAGTYLIKKGVKNQFDKTDSRINMVPNMLFWLDDQAVIQKEPNEAELYHTMYIGYGADNVTLRGGTYRGDRDTHNYSQKDHPSSPGTHEGGYGIMTGGAENVKVEGVKSERFTGDGMIVEGRIQLIQDLYEASFESGSIDDAGRKVADGSRIRTKVGVTLDPKKKPIFETEPYFEISNRQKLPADVDLYFYKADRSFLSKKSGVKLRERVDIPAGADHVYLVYRQSSVTGAYVEVWSRVQAENIVIQHSEFAFNRRQGITVGGGNRVTIQNNEIHDTSGIAPQSGIDVEGGYAVNGQLNTNVWIKNNHLYRNKAYDVILYDGHDAIVEGNHLASSGVFGLAVSEGFSQALIQNNHFDGSRIIAYHDATFKNNRMNNGTVFLEGPNVVVDGMEVTDSLFSVTAKQKFGVKVSNLSMTFTEKKPDVSLSVWGQPVHFTNVTLTGQPALRSIVGGAAEGSIFDNLKVVGFNPTYGLNLPPGTYNQCYMEPAEGGNLFGAPAPQIGGTYVFDGCTFKTNKGNTIGLYIDKKDADVTIKNSTFDVLGNTHAVSVQSAKRFVFEKNTVRANQLTSPTVEIIKINDQNKRNEPYDVYAVTISGNTITSNLAAPGISTVNAGTGAPSYLITNNVLTKAKLALKANDVNTNNKEQ
jgi:hypothetical protein